MSSAISRFLTDLLAVGLAGGTIKLLDDYLDLEQDTACGRPSLVRAFGGGVVAYAIVCAMIASGLNVGLAAPLVMAAYVVGMFKDPVQMLALGLPAWMESVLVAALAWALFGWRATVVSLLLMTGIQLADDLYDYAGDSAPSATNLARILGKGATLLACGVAALAAFVVDPRTTLLVCISAPAVEVVARVAGTSGGEEHDA